MAMRRIAILVKPEQDKKLAYLAKNAGVSVGEMHRRAIDRYVESSADQDEEVATLNLMLAALQKSNAEAELALTEALQVLQTTVMEIQANKE